MDQKPVSIPSPAKTINEVLSQLDNIIDLSVNSNDYLFVFAFVYRKTTQKVKDAIESGRFEDNKRMETMDVIFANLFIEAYYNFLSSRTISNAWRVAFESKNIKLAIVQHILLGMNAHINLDLSIAAASVAKGSSILNIKNDFMIINDILKELTNSMQKDLGKASILMKLLDFFGFRSDEKIINFSIKKARDFAWLNAMELALVKKEKQSSRITEIDNRVLKLGKMIRNSPSLFLRIVLRSISRFEVNDKKLILQKMSQE